MTLKENFKEGGVTEFYLEKLTQPSNFWGAEKYSPWLGMLASFIERENHV